MSGTPRPIAALLDQAWASVAACALLTLPYWWSGLAKLADWPSALAEARHFGLEPAGVVAGATIVLQLGASALLIAGRYTWLAAGALAVFTAAATLIAHRFWTLDDPVARFHDLNSFLAHAGLIGGLAAAAIAAERRRTP